MGTHVDRASVEHWLSMYKHAWENRDSTAAGRLFTHDATYAKAPFEPPFEGREAIERYWANAVSDQRDVSFSSEFIACDGDDVAAHWHVAYTEAGTGQRIELDGVFRLRFASEESVNRFQEWWHVKQ